MIKNEHGEPVVSLFKYLNISGAQKTLATNAIRLTRPLEFNDPFDINLEELFGSDHAEFHQGLLEAHCDFVCGEIDYAKLPDNAMKAKMIAINQALRRASQEQRAAFKAELLQTPVGELYDTASLEELRSNTLEQVRQMLRFYGVFCATKRHDDLLMWAHYANKHTGVVFEFYPDVENDSMFLAAKAVAYSKDRPLMYRTPADMIRRAYTMSPGESGMTMLNNIVFTKSTAWEYEQEVRLAIPDLVKEGETFATLKFARHELRSIYFGCRISQADKDKVATLGRGLNSKVKLFQAATSKRNYTLEYAELS